MFLIFVVIFCRVSFRADRQEKEKRGLQAPRTIQAFFLYSARLLNINRARFAAGWKRNFSLLRHTLYHKKKSLSIVFFNFSDYFFFRFSNFFAFCLRICNGYVSKPCCGYEPPGVLCPDAEAAHCDIPTC